MVNTHIMGSVRSMEPLLLLGTHIIEIKGRTREKAGSSLSTHTLTF